MKPDHQVHIRPAHPADGPILASAEREIARTPGFLVSQPEELTDLAFESRIRDLAADPNGNYLVAEVDGHIVGHAMLDPFPIQSLRHVVRLTIAVHPGWQGGGVGRKLLFQLIDWARATISVEKIELHVREPNVAARSLYEKAGFEYEGTRRRRIKVGPNQYMDDVQMGLWVGESSVK